ncbi:hypothetical protein HY625_03200 [Candidatus Uhrbacteria bacterium]|nr:hypothetical protein [Candidatus Uhrbacteria bacterium]
MYKTLQIPVKEDLRDRAVKVAEEQGFSSLQEAVRIFLGQFAARKISVTFTNIDTLSPKNERRYAHMIDDVRLGKTKTKKFRNTASLMEHLQR